MKPNPKSKHNPWIYDEVVRNPAPRACLVSTPLGPIRRNHSQIRRAHTKPVHHYQAKPAHLEMASLPGAGRRRANGRKPTVNPTDRRTKPTNGPNSRRTKPTGGTKLTDGPTDSHTAKQTDGPTKTGDSYIQCCF